MLIDNSRKQQDVNILLGFGAVASIKLKGFKIAAGTLVTFAGEFFTEEIERQSRYNVVQIEVSFVSKGRDNDKLISLLCGCFL